MCHCPAKRQSEKVRLSHHTSFYENFNRGGEKAGTNEITVSLLHNQNASFFSNKNVFLTSEKWQNSVSTRKRVHDAIFAPIALRLDHESKNTQQNEKDDVQKADDDFQ